MGVTKGRRRPYQGNVCALPADGSTSGRYKHYRGRLTRVCDGGHAPARAFTGKAGPESAGAEPARQTRLAHQALLRPALLGNFLVGTGLELTLFCVSGQDRPKGRKSLGSQRRVAGGAVAGGRADAGRATCIPPNVLPGRRRLGPRAYQLAPGSLGFRVVRRRGTCLLPASSGLIVQCASRVVEEPQPAFTY